MRSEPLSSGRATNRFACRIRLSRRSSRSASVTYNRNFAQKNLHRCEHELFIFYEARVLESRHSISESQHSQGERFLLMPSARKVAQSEAGQDWKLKLLPEVREL